jgi:hypothetical protein
MPTYPALIPKGRLQGQTLKKLFARCHIKLER